MSDFWARRKAAVEAEEADLAREEQAATEAEARAAFEDQPDEEILRALELPDPDTMKAGDDFSAFLQKTVPERIRVRALRRLWTTNPVLANLDGLIDYGEDFTNASTVMENLQTAYRVGQGMAKHVEEMAKKAASEAEDATEVTVAADVDEQEGSEKSYDSAQEPNSASPAIPDKNSQLEMAEIPRESDGKTEETCDTDAEFSFKPRRMRYRFDE